MPVMDGMTCLSRIMVLAAKPVVMVVLADGEGAEATLQALSLGAVDFVLKPDGTISLSVDRIRGNCWPRSVAPHGLGCAGHRTGAAA